MNLLNHDTRECSAHARTVHRFTSRVHVPLRVPFDIDAQPLLDGHELRVTGKPLMQRSQLRAESRKVVRSQSGVEVRPKGTHGERNRRVNPVAVPVVGRVGKLAAVHLHLDEGPARGTDPGSTTCRA
jgi:hypothetical protein